MEHPSLKPVISCSRRSDVPRWHCEWLMASLQAGAAAYCGPGGRIGVQSLRPEDVHSLVFWSKDFRFFVNDSALSPLLMPFNLYFHFTITGLGGTAIEPGVAPAEVTLLQLRALTERWGPGRINWRFDPIVYWNDGQMCSNLDLFPRLGEAVAAAGVRRCTFSFADWRYRKCQARARKRGFPYVDPSAEAKLEAAARLAEMAAPYGLTLYTCASPQWAAVPGIQVGACIDGALLAALHPNGYPAALGKDKGQRPQCGCTPSVDIGTYGRCPHSCVYCYANPPL